MSEITIGSFGEQTLDALLAVEYDTQGKKNDSSSLRSSKTNSRFKKSSLLPLQEISENLVANHSKKCLAPPRQSHREQKPTNDDSNIDKYFQDSIILSKFDTQDLCSSMKRSVSSSSSNKKAKTVNSDKASRSKKGTVVKKQPIRSSKAKKTTKVTEAKQDLEDSLDETFFIENSGDESSHVIKEAEALNVRAKKGASNSLPKTVEAKTSSGKKNGARYEQVSTSDKIFVNNEAQNDERTEQRVEIAGRKESAQIIIRNSSTDAAANLRSSMNSVNNTEERCKLSAWGLPQDILQVCEKDW